MSAIDAVDGPPSKGIAMCHFEVSFDGLLNVAYWLGREVRTAANYVCCPSSFGHSEKRFSLSDGNVRSWRWSGSAGGGR